MDLGDIQFTLSVQTGALMEGLSQASEALAEFAEAQRNGGNGAEAAAQKMDAAMRRMGETASQSGKVAAGAADQTAVAMTALAAACAKAFSMIVGAVNSGIEASNKYKAAIQGLQSVATAKGIGSDAIQRELDGLVDQFFSAASASTALKNLLSRGYSLEQAVNSINRLKDAAAFGRQASYSLGDAVVSATEGLKNENSILVDNAGVTKNVSKMWDDYARSIGTTAGSLTQAQKIEAEYQGIMSETSAQVGDLAKLSDTLAGSQAESQAKTVELSQALGESMTPSVMLATEAWNSLLGLMSQFVAQNPSVVAGVTTTIGVVTGLGACVSGIRALTKAFEYLKIAGSTIGWLAAIGAAIGLFVGIIDSINRASQAAAKAQQEALEASKSKADELAKENSALEKLAARYETLSGLTDRSRAETAEMRSIEQQLQSTYGLTGAALSGLAGSYDEVIKKIREKITAQKEEQLQESKTQMRIMQSQLEDNPYYEEMQNLERYKRDLQTYADTINNNQLFNNLDFSAQEEIKAKYNEINDEIAVATDNLEKMDAKYREEYMSLSGEMADLSVQIPVLEFEIANGSASEMTSAIVGAFSGAINAAAPGLSGAYSDAINSILSDADLSKTAENADALFDTLTGGGVLTADEQGQLADYIYSIWATLYKNIPKEFSGDKDGLMSQMFSQLFSVTPEMDNLASWIASFSEGNTQRLFETDQLESYTSKVNDAANAYDTAAKSSLELQEAMKQAQAAQEEAGQGTQEYDDALAEYNALSAELNAKNLESEAAFEALSEIIATVSELYPDLTSGSEAENQAQASLVAAYRRGDAVLQQRGRTLKSTTKAVASSTKEFNKYTASQKDLQKWIDDQTDSLARMNREIANSSELFSDVSGIKAQIDAGAQLDATQTGLIASLGLMGSTAQETSDNCAAWLARMADTLQGEIGKAESASNDLSDSLSFLSAMHPDIKIGTSSAIAAMKAVVAQAIITIGYLNKAGIPTGGGGGGGGGNSKYQKDITALEHLKKLEQVDNEQELERLLELQQKYTNRRGKSTLKKADQRDLEERLFEVREKIREEAFNADMDEYEHRKRMGEMTVEQEIECLEKIKAAHELNADELWDMDERLYDLRKQLREDEKNDYEKSVTDTYDEVVSALQKRYEKERDIETKALKDKLDALDKEEKAEDDAEQRQEYRQELSDLQRKLRTEKSARERREIQKEIEELTANEEERLRDLEREKQRDEINAEIEAVNEKYDKLVSEENIRQEALRVCMDSNLAEITELIESYGDEWKNAGQSLAEALTGGLVGGSEGILGVLKGVQDAISESVNAQLKGISAEIADKSGSAFGGGVNVYVSDLTVREEADVEKVAQAILDDIKSAEKG